MHELIRALSTVGFDLTNLLIISHIFKDIVHSNLHFNDVLHTKI